MTDLTPEEQEILRKLGAYGKPALESQIKSIPAPRRAEALQSLIARSDYIEIFPPRGRAKKPQYGLTDHGREQAASLPAKPRKSTARGPSPPRITASSLAPSVEVLREQLVAHEARLSRLEAMLSGRAPAPSPPSTAPEIAYQDFRSAAREAFDRVDQTGQTRGLVPIPDLRRALAGRVTHELFDTYLLQMHREGAISLLPHHHPASLPEDHRADALQHATAGLLYFVRWLAP